MSQKALIIGINYIGTNAALRGCINDTLNIKDFLGKEFSLKDQEIHLMTEAGSKDLQPTRANILKQIEWLVEGATEDSRLFIHYSGHGTQVRDISGDENDGRDECLCPLDYSTAGLITDDVLRAKLVDPLPKGARLFGLFDCCHSGTVLDLKYNYLFHTGDMSQSYEMKIELAAKRCKGDITMISGCLDSQTSADAYINRKSQGAMTYSFLKSYKTLKAKKRPMTCQRLMKELHKNIRKGRFTQRPKLSTGTQINLTQKLQIF